MVIKPSKALQDIVDRLRQEETRWDAILQLKLLKGDEHIPDLIRLLSDSDWIIRWCIAEKLGDFRDVRGVKALVRLLSDADFHVRKNASKALLRIGADAVPFLVPLFSHADARVRGLVLTIVISMGKGIIPILENAITNQNWVVSHRIVDAIWRLGGEKVETALVRLLANKVVQKHVIILLGITQSKLAISHLAKSFNEPRLRRVVVYALYRIGEKEAYPTIVTSLQSSSASVASLSEKIVCKIGRPMLPYLLSALKKKQAKKKLILTVMGKIGVAPALPHLEKVAAADPEIDELMKQLNLRVSSKQSGLFGGIFGKTR